MRPSELSEMLRAAGSAEPEREAEIIAERYMAVTPARFAVKDTEFEATDEALDAVRRRALGEPLQYILGTWYFMNEEYEVTPDVLIPRQDTETLVSWAIENIPRGARFADLCTGSGCVAISTLAARDDLSCVAVDLYDGALEVASRNAARCGVADRVTFVKGDVLAGEGVDGEVSVILANPPYVTDDEYGALERELYFEPRHALTDGGDGLSFYRAILCKYRPSVFAFEIGINQAEGIERIAKERAFTVEFIKDFSGARRVAVCRRGE